MGCLRARGETVGVGDWCEEGERDVGEAVRDVRDGMRGRRSVLLVRGPEWWEEGAHGMSGCGVGGQKQRIDE